MHLDGKGRCCGRKPLKYKRADHPPHVCTRCWAAYDASGEQIENHAWTRTGDGVWVQRRPSISERDQGLSQTNHKEGGE